MKHAAAILLLALAKKEINEKNINEILGSVGIKANPAVVKALLNAVKDKTPEQLIAEGLPKLAAVSAGPVAATSAPVEKKEEPKKKEEKKKAPEPEPEEEGGLGFLF